MLDHEKRFPGKKREGSILQIGFDSKKPPSGVKQYSKKCQVSVLAETMENV